MLRLTNGLMAIGCGIISALLFYYDDYFAGVQFSLLAGACLAAALLK